MSKLPRGLLNAYGLPPLTSRMIPARAGFTTQCSPSCRGGPDHPRSRGVYWYHSMDSNEWGSSPLARGLPPRPERTRPRNGDHPRSRGVYQETALVLNSMVGSSPLARGLRVGHVAVVVSRGIIPARAGFTPLSSAASDRQRDHPRSRGVYVQPIFRTAWCWGSSPLARGLPGAHPGAVGASGIIPARAGFTCQGSGTLSPHSDHPRSRGVYAPSSWRTGPALGSSPLARGLPEQIHSLMDQPRIIPARAGFTARCRRCRPRWSDHPRSRGVYP